MKETKSPYTVLGIPETASKETIDTAYSTLMERFSEANYLGSPLWDLAAEKRKAIQAAYDALTGAGETPDPAEAAQPPEPAPPEAPAEETRSPNVRIRTLLNSGRPEEALSLLNEQPDRETNPEWIYLRGMASWKRGWLDEANQCVKKAAQMAPNNAEFQNALAKLRITPGPPSAPEKVARRLQCVRDNSGECCTEVCCMCICDGICDSLDGC